MRTSIPIDMLSSKGRAGSALKTTGRGVTTEAAPENGSEIVALRVDTTNGTIVLEKANGEILSASGLLTTSNIVTGPPGPKGDAGVDGRDGEDGRDGDQGPTGAQGPAGLRGEQGPEGPRGPQGLQGSTGPTGPQGPRGDDGFLQIYIQVSDPALEAGSPVSAGAVWVKPPEAATNGEA